MLHKSMSLKYEPASEPVNAGRRTDEGEVEDGLAVDRQEVEREHFRSQYPSSSLLS